jgi:hypothetical protein
MLVPISGRWMMPTTRLLVAVLGLSLLLTGVPAGAAAQPSAGGLPTEAARLRHTVTALTATIVEQADVVTRTTTSQSPAVWREYIETVHVTRHVTTRAVATVDRIRQHLAATGVKPESVTVTPAHMMAALHEWLGTASLPASLRGRLGKQLTVPAQTFGLPSLGEMLRHHVEALDAYLARLNAVAGAVDRTREVFDAIGYLSDVAPAPRPKFICDVLCFITIVGAIVEGIGFLVAEAETDEGPRTLFLSAPCSDLRALSPEDRIAMLRALSDGPTLDGDELAILRLFSCLDCDDLAHIWFAMSSRLLYDFDGDEWDRLMLLMKDCDIVDFTEFDDDASRAFIHGHDCAVLNRLSNADIRVLLLHMFSGPTEEEDERAIIRLVECLPVDRVADLMRLPGLSYDDFDDEVDGAEWTRLRARLDIARAISP